MFNALFTMHATTMIFLAIMPLQRAFFNFMVPLQIGARDVAFPRLNAFSYWVFLLGGIILNVSFLFGGAPDAGWFGYANLTRSSTRRASTSTSGCSACRSWASRRSPRRCNFFVTILNMRAPGHDAACACRSSSG